VRFAGFADASPRLFKRVLILLAASAALPAAAQNPQARDYYQQGVQALTDRQFEQARQALTRAVELDPDFAGAWVDLALATYAAGDIAQAEEFLTILEQRFTLPEPIAQAVAGLRGRIAAGQAAVAAASRGWAWRTTVQAGGGHDSNANAGLALNDLTLTLPGGGVLLPVSPTLRPQTDRFAVASVSASGLRDQPQGQLELAGSVKARRNAQASDFDTLDLQAAVGWATTRPLPGGGLGGLLPGPWRAGLAAQHLKLGGSALLNSVVLSGTHVWAGASCNPQATVESDWRTFPVANNLNSRTLWVGASASCPGLYPARGGRWNALLRVGQETARSPFLSSTGRPGGNTRHTELTLTHAWSWQGSAGNHRLEAQAQWARAHDTQGYSPLLANDARREVQRSTASLSYTVPLAPVAGLDAGWQATLAMQGFRQRSNLELFRLSGRIIQASIQKTW
jgi:hypothetical protein